MADAPLYGILAEFETPEQLVEAAKRTRAAGFCALDAFTPFPVEGLAELLEFRDNRVLWLGLLGGCFGFATALLMQCFTNFDYPIEVGGRPLYALSAFAVVAFELTVLFGALTPAFGMLVLNGLPRLNYPVFRASRFHLASRDRFFLCIKAEDPRFDASTTRRWLEQLGAQSVELVAA
jgi:Protein of unknown function (DUF3341)